MGSIIMHSQSNSQTKSHSRLQRVPGRPGLALLLLGAAALLAACQPPNKAAESPSGTGGGKPIFVSSNASVAFSNVSISALRERALQVVEETTTASDPTLRANAAEAAAYAPARLRSVLDRALRDPNSGVRAVAASAIGKSKLSGFRPAVSPLVTDSLAITRVCAIYAMIRDGAQVDRSPISQILLTDPSPSAKRQAAEILGLLGDRSAKPLLKAASKERFPELSPLQVRLLQLQIAAALVRLGEDGQRPVIRAALYPQSADELEAAVFSIQLLGELEDREAAAQLKSLAEYKDRTGQRYPPEVRLAVATSLAQLGMTQGSFVADEYLNHPAANVRSQVAFVYGATRGPQNGNRLAQLIEDSDAQVRIAAAGAILKSLARVP